MVPVRYNLRSLAVRARTTYAAAAGVGLVVFVAGAALMLSDAVNRMFSEVSRDDAVIIIKNSADNEFSSSIFDADANTVMNEAAILREQDVPLASSELVVAATLPKVDGTRSSVTLRGVPDHALKVRAVEIVAGRAPRFSAGEILVGERTRGRFRGLELGQTLELRKGQPLRVVGVFRGGAAYDSEVWVDRELLRATFNRPGRLTSVYARLRSPEAFAQLRQALAEQPRLGVQVMRERDYFQARSDGTAAFIRAMGVLITVLFGIAAMIGATITMSGSVANRSREIGTLHALGFARSHILLGFLLESVTVTLAGGGAGAVALTALGFVRLSMIDLKTRSEIVLQLQPTASVLVVALVSAIGLGITGGLLPAVAAARVSPGTAMRS
jgi:putative ABC transport system permease protein